ncbi:hypothetical protein [Nocardioides caldifontis]|uniref:hypothetical protein n=1 Tax=Nocardioides caldifontis TaxID=2588938 RepID=UPI0011DF062B|nr:hypothetical protein [Nocardioides caldifontis]
MSTNPAEPGPHDEPHTPAAPDPDQVRTDIPGVDPDWPQTAVEPAEAPEPDGQGGGNVSEEG